MRKTLIVTLTLLAGTAATLSAQRPSPANVQPMGRGRVGAPLAWNDTNKDGICDVTGRPVGQGRGLFGRRIGRAQGNLANAWNDVDRDGIYDVTGRPIGRGFAAGRGRWLAGRQQANARRQP